MSTQDQTREAIETAIAELGLSPDDYTYIGTDGDTIPGVVRCFFYDAEKNVVAQKDVSV